MVWHDGFQVWLTESQSLDNAQKVADHLLGKNGWTKESICALVGNMRVESSVNPNMYEYGYDWSADRGFGLVQWTPRSKYWDWAVAQGKEPRNGDSELDRIDYEVDNNIQWIPVSSYGGMTFSQFRSNSGGWSIDYLTEAFTWSYERPAASAGQSSMPDRQAFANLAASSLSWSGSGGSGGDGGGSGGDGGGSGGDGGGSGGSGATVQYIDERGDMLMIKYAGRSALVAAYPLGVGRWVPRVHDSGSGGSGGDGGGDGGNGGGSGGSGGFTSPASGTITSRYGPRNFPSSPFHAGIDIANDIGTPIYAALGGTVVGVGANLAPGRSGDRNVLIESDDSSVTAAQYYGHCSENFVSVGQHVNSGDKIALIGARGNVTGPHLHFETWETTDPGSHFDPEDVFSHYGVTPGE